MSGVVVEEGVRAVGEEVADGLGAAADQGLVEGPRAWRQEKWFSNVPPLYSDNSGVIHKKKNLLKKLLKNLLKNLLRFVTLRK